MKSQTPCNLMMLSEHTGWCIISRDWQEISQPEEFDFEGELLLVKKLESD